MNEWNFDIEALIMSLIGMIVYFLVMLEIKKSKTYTFKKFIYDEWVQMLIAVFLCLIMAAYIDEIMKGISKDLDKEIYWSEYYYLLGGIWLNLVIQIFSKLGALAKVFADYVTKRLKL